MKLFGLGLAALFGFAVWDGCQPMQCHNGFDWEISGRHWNEYRYCNTPYHVRETETFVRTLI